jgi:hypothetical protein
MPLVDLRVRHLCALLLGCWAANKLPLRLHPEDRDNQEKKETYMSKNLTRKGLALGALIALGASLIAGAPASASVESSKIKLFPTAGETTTYNTIAGASFELSNDIDSAIKTADNKNLAKLAFQVTNSSAARINIQLDGTNATYGHLNYRSADAEADLATLTSDVADVTGTSKKFAVYATASSQSLDSSDSGSVNHIKITTTTDATEAFDVTVQAFIDDNQDGKIDANEYVSVARTIHFIPTSAVTVTPSVTSAAIGANTIQGQVVLGNDINMKSLGNSVGISFANNGVYQILGSAAAALSATTNDAVSDTTYNSDKAALVSNVTALVTPSAIAAGTIVAQAYFGLAGSYPIKLGSTSSAATTVAGTDNTVDGTDYVKAANSASVKFTKGSAASAWASTTAVRTGYVGDIAFSSYVLSADGTDSATATNIRAKSGITVRVTLTAGTTFTTGNSFTAGGVTLTKTSGAVFFDTTSDADGKIAFTGKAGVGTKGDSVEVSIKALKASAYLTADKNTLTWDDAAAQAPVVTNVQGKTGSVLKIAKGDTYTLNFSVSDNFGQAWTAADRRIAISTSGNGTAFAYYPALAAGKATQAIIDNSTATGNYTVTAQLQKLSSGAWVNEAAATTVAVYANAEVTSTVTADASTSVAQATIAKALVASDLRVDGNVVSAASIGYANDGLYISGTAKNALGVGVAGQTVTIAGAGLAFISEDGNIYGVGSITVNADVNGAYKVFVKSATAGKATVTVTAGAATKTAAVEFSGITTLDTKGTITLDVASLSQVGRSVTVSILVKDSYGNPVNTASALVAVSVTGVGSLSAATVDTDAKGVATVQFVAGANDFGDAVITAKYTNADDTVVSATKTLTVGVTDAQVDVVNNRVTAVASFSKGKTVGFYVDGVKKWSKLSASDADVVINYNLKKGRHTVTVKISGGFVTTEVIVVK